MRMRQDTFNIILDLAQRRVSAGEYSSLAAIEEERKGKIAAYARQSMNWTLPTRPTQADIEAAQIHKGCRLLPETVEMWTRNANVYAKLATAFFKQREAANDRH